MVFNSLPFLLFFPCVVLLYYSLPKQKRWVLLLLASYIFYGFWKIEYLALIILSTVVDYSVAKYLSSEPNEIKRRAALIVSLATNLGMLFLFKYADWFLTDIAHIGETSLASSMPMLREGLNLALPVGISFYTFQTMSYTLDVYYRRISPETNIFKFSLFVSFFPQLVAGPIERFSRLNKELFEHHQLTMVNIKHGLRLMLWGLFIKMCVADNLSPIVDQIFENHSEASSWQLISGMLGFSFQIYADFQGYSLIAIGAARVLGMQLIYNFDAPYSADSIRNFWSRWHISLSTWFRDYLYLPLGGNRKSRIRTWINIIVVFSVSGLWHGSNLTFLIWGIIHALAYLIQSLSPIRNNSAPIIRIIRHLTTLSVVCFAWVFFRATSVHQGFEFISNIVNGNNGGINLEWDPLLITFLGLFVLSDFVFEKGNLHAWIGNQPMAVRWLAYSILLYFILGFAGTTNHPFIYFQF